MAWKEQVIIPVCCIEACPGDEPRNRVIHSHIKDWWRQRTRKGGKNSLCTPPAYEYIDKLWWTFTWFCGVCLTLCERCSITLHSAPSPMAERTEKVIWVSITWGAMSFVEWLVRDRDHTHLRAACGSRVVYSSEPSHLGSSELPAPNSSLVWL